MAFHLLKRRTASFFSRSAGRQTTHPTSACASGGRRRRQPPACHVRRKIVELVIGALHDGDRFPFSEMHRVSISTEWHRHPHLATDLKLRHNMWCYTLDKRSSRAHIGPPNEIERPSEKPPASREFAAGFRVPFGQRFSNTVSTAAPGAGDDRRRSGERPE
jgi:hypothetical protein